MKFDMPIISPVPIETRGKNFFTKMGIWMFSVREWKVEEDYRFIFNGLEYFIPKGFVFDGASIPRIFWSTLSPTGLLFIPAIFHDYGYRYEGYIVREAQGTPNFVQKTRADIDETFKEMNDFVNGMKAISIIAWGAVQLGFFQWKKHRKNNLKSILRK